MLQDFTLEHSNPELVAWALRQVVDWGVLLDGYFLCPTPPVVPRDEHPSHTVAHYREHHGQPIIDRTRPLSGHIAAVGACQCLGRPTPHSRYASAAELSAAVLELLRAADPTEFLRTAGGDGPFHGTDSAVRAGYRLHYCSWYGRGLWLSFRHNYVGK
jgi:hypothetical protein